MAELFEARKPKDSAIIAEIDGRDRVRQGLQEQAAHHRSCPRTATEPVEYLIPKGKHIVVQEGDYVEKGDSIVDGNPARTTSCACSGVEELAEYLVNEIQEVYRLQGVKINDKHIEVIVRQMLQKVEIVDPGDTDVPDGRAGRQASSSRRRTQSVDARAARPATGQPVLLGITKASLQTRVVHLGGLASRRPPACSPRPRSTARSTS